MKSRLFWKVFAGFCGVFFAQLLALWLIVIAVLPDQPEWVGRMNQYVAPRFELLAANVIRRGGYAELAREIAHGDRPLTIDAVVSRPARSERYHYAVAPDGSGYRIRYAPPQHFKEDRSSPPTLFIVSGIVSALVFATLFGLYFVRPIRRLREGLNRFSHGELSVRLSDGSAKRRDEIADLALHFDAMAERVEGLIRSREQLLDDVSHEIRSPLARLQLAIALARQKPDGTTLALDRIGKEARRLDRMANTLLTLSRLEAGMPAPDRYIDLDALVSEVADDVSFEATPRRITIEINRSTLSDEGVNTAGDADLLRSAIENVLRNALKFSNANSRITISLIEEEAYSSVIIDDEGPGVPTVQQSAIFDPFRRGDGETGGFGLGLSIAKRAIQMHGGSIRAETAPSRGLRIVMTIPRA